MSIHPVSVHSGSAWSASCLALSRHVRASLRQSLGWRTDRVVVVMFVASFRGGLSLAVRCHWSQAPHCHPPPITIPRWSYSDSLYYDPRSQDGRTTSETRISSFALCCSRSHGGIIQIPSTCGVGHCPDRRLSDGIPRHSYYTQRSPPHLSNLITQTRTRFLTYGDNSTKQT